MKEIAIDAFAKINLALDVLHKRPDGYHEINTIMQQIDLKDKVILKNRDDHKTTIECNNKSVPLDKNNLAYKAWDSLVKKTNIKRGIHIKIEKNIPVAAGLAGGSSNAAAVLKGLNHLWDLGLSQEELMNIGGEIGADIPFCILGGTAQAQGIGEKLIQLKSFKDKPILLANIGLPLTSAYVYEQIDLYSKHRPLNIDSIIKYMDEDNTKKVAENMVNSLEAVALKEYPVLAQIKEDMKRNGALGSLITGSGPTVFGIFEDEEKLLKCKDKLKGKVHMLIPTKTI